MNDSEKLRQKVIFNYNKKWTKWNVLDAMLKFWKTDWHTQNEKHIEIRDWIMKTDQLSIGYHSQGS